MIKIENLEVYGWEPAIRGMRNSHNSWDKSDSGWLYEDQPTSNDIFVERAGEQSFWIGPADQELMLKLARAGSDHRKFMRMINVYIDVTAPIYWWPEMDSYKVAVVRNSCSFMHSGTKKEFEIDDFSVQDERVYHILNDLPQKKYVRTIPYETDEFKIYTDDHNKTYRVYRNGIIIREAFEYTDSFGNGRHRIIPEKEATVWQNRNGYFFIRLSGRNSFNMPLHHMVAEVWCEKPEGATQINHINANKGDNSAENLEWVTPKENIQHAIENGLYDNVGSFHKRYRSWKNSMSVLPISKRVAFSMDCNKGLTHNQLAKKWNITPEQANNIRYSIKNNENEDLFQLTYQYEQLLKTLNDMRQVYLQTGDQGLFQAIRALTPQGYMQRSTLMLNYEVLRNIYHARKNHRLDEWRYFCKWIETLPFSELITGPEKKLVMSVNEYRKVNGLDAVNDIPVIEKHNVTCKEENDNV